MQTRVTMFPVAGSLRLHLTPDELARVIKALEYLYAYERSQRRADPKDLELIARLKELLTP